MRGECPICRSPGELIPDYGTNGKRRGAICHGCHDRTNKVFHSWWRSSDPEPTGEWFTQLGMYLMLGAGDDPFVLPDEVSPPAPASTEGGTP